MKLSLNIKVLAIGKQSTMAILKLTKQGIERMRKRKMFQRPSETIRDMEGELLEVRKVVGDIKKLRLRDCPNDIQERIRTLFKITSGSYSFED